MRNVIIAAIMLCACEDPVAYAESWHNNSCYDGARLDGAGVKDEISRAGFEIEIDPDLDDLGLTNIVAKKVYLRRWDWSTMWHELTHVRQYVEHGASMGARWSDDEWRWAYEAQAFRQQMLLYPERADEWLDKLAMFGDPSVIEDARCE